MKIEFEPNQLIDNRYKIIKKLDEGGMGAVWKATDARTNDSIVVLKFPLKYNDPEILERFAREAGTMRALAGDCDNILDIQDIGSVAVNDIDNVPYYVMRFQTGGALRDWKVPQDDQGKSVFTRESLNWVTGVATALDFLHQQDEAVFHRDVKPENILFNASGTPKLSDFGIVKSIKKATTNITKTGAGMGTVAYMPPEIWRGGDFSPASDQFSFVSTVYEMVAGNRPYDGSTPFAMLESLSQGHEKLSDTIDLSAAASNALDKGLSHEPDDRFNSCGDFAKAFLKGLHVAEAPIPVLAPDPVPGPSEGVTGVHVGPIGAQVGDQVVGGKPIVTKPPVAVPPSSTGQGLEEPPVKPLPPPTALTGDGGLPPLARLFAAVLLLTIFAGGGLYLFGAFSGSSAADFSTSSLDQELTYDEYQQASLSLLQAHADFGHPIAQDVLGDRFSSGEGAERDESDAEYWYRKSAEQGNMHAQYSLSNLYRPRYAEDKEVEADETEAFLWMRKSAESGNAKAYSDLASDYRHGNGVEADGSQAVYWYEKAAEEEDTGYAEFELGEIFEEGVVVRQDIPQSRMWFRRAKLGSGYLSEIADHRLEFGVGQKAPDLAGKDGNGVGFELSDYRGKVVWLTFWTKY